MFERFTERARQVIVLAQEEARAFPHAYIGTEHLLLGLIREEEGLAARVLASLDVTVERTREAVLESSAPVDKAPTGQIPFTLRAKKVCELALREALALGHNYIGTEHILFGLVRDNEGIASNVLRDFGHDAEKIRNEIIRLLSGSRQPSAPTRLLLPVLSRDAVEWLADIAGRQPHTHPESGEVYEAALRALRANPASQAA